MEVDCFTVLGGSDSAGEKTTEQPEEFSFLMDDLHQTAAWGLPAQLEEESGSEQSCIGLFIEDEDYIRDIEEFQGYLDRVKGMVKPGCSPEVLNVALSSISSLVNTLTYMSSLKLHSSL